MSPHLTWMVCLPHTAQGTLLSRSALHLQKIKTAGCKLSQHHVSCKQRCH
jgi:hypothetical protein